MFLEKSRLCRLSGLRGNDTRPRRSNSPPNLQPLRAFLHRNLEISTQLLQRNQLVPLLTPFFSNPRDHIGTVRIRITPNRLHIPWSNRNSFQFHSSRNKHLFSATHPHTQSLLPIYSLLALAIEYRRYNRYIQHSAFYRCRVQSCSTYSWACPWL